jgi:hypothetical protein
MTSDFRRKLATALGIEQPKPECHVQNVYNDYKRHLAGKVLETPLPERVHLCDENFPYWIKLEWMNPKTGSWQAASPAIVIPLLEVSAFKEEEYRLTDPRRARQLLNIPHLLRNPDSIHPNRTAAIRGDHAYIQTYRGHFKVAFTLHDTKLNKIILVSSFQTTKKWIEKNVKHPPAYTKTKATR